MAFNFSGKGTVRDVQVYTSAKGKDITTVVVETGGEYSQSIPVKFFGRLAGEARGYQKGAEVEVVGRVGGREWNGKYYADVVGESISEVKKADEGGKAKDAAPTPQQDDDPPF